MANLMTRRLALAGAATALAAPHVARAAVRTVRLGHNSVATTQFGQGGEAFAAAVAAHPVLSPVLRVDVRGNAQLGDELAMLTDCRKGTVDLMIGGTQVATKFCPEIGMLDVPFVFRDVDKGRRAMDGRLGDEFAASMKAADINVVAWFENGLRQLTSNKPVRTPEDLRGFKLRVPQSETAIKSFRALGVDAQPLPFTQVYEALRVGKFDGQENPIGTIEDNRLYEVQKYLCLTGHMYAVAFLAASPDLMEDLTPPQVIALRECGRKGTERSREVAAASARDGVERLRKAGMQVIHDVDVGAFIAAARPSLQSLGDTFGAARVERLIAEAA